MSDMDKQIDKAQRAHINRNKDIISFHSDTKDMTPSELKSKLGRWSSETIFKAVDRAQKKYGRGKGFPTADAFRRLEQKADSYRLDEIYPKMPYRSSPELFGKVSQTDRGRLRKLAAADAKERYARSKGRAKDVRNVK
jgi:hypothetical protein